MFSHIYHHLNHRLATPGWVATATGVVVGVWSHRTLAVLSALAILTGMAYHAVLAACAFWKTKAEVEAIRDRRKYPWVNYPTWDGPEKRN